MAIGPTLPETRPLRRLVGALLLAWLSFWILMMAAGVQEQLLRGGGGAEAWRPVIAEGTSMLVATVLAVVQWHTVKRLDRHLARPHVWFARALVWTPLIALAFVLVVQGLRAALYAAFGMTHRISPAGPLLLYETSRFAIFYVLFVGIQFGVRSYIAWTEARVETERQRALSQQAQLLQLTQQLQPHFLFNALNTVSSLIHSEPDRADALLTELAALLRAATDAGQRPRQSLEDELRLLRAYAAIMSARFADRVGLRWDIDPASLRCEVPTLCLQPLLENCFRHVVEPRRAATAIVVSSRLADGVLTIAVDDDGGRLDAPPAFGVGLRNVQERLQVLHGDAARVGLSGRPEGGVRARVELPCAC
ncbi:MAG TPA: histidine kinase [Caldimonas sp.]|nr:histidine kinase [Caldimonas sp.]HEX2539665.1 histidine kinase [Caldimonas sp.]